MKRLSGSDAVFLSMETPSWHQHVGGLTILDPEGSDLSFENVIRTVTDRIGLAPKFRWKLKDVPFHLDRPVWVDDPTFDVRRHIRRIAVPAPGGRAEVAEVAGALLGTQLDRGRPLWEMWYIEGLADGRVALLMKYHHCLLDGVAGASLATALMDIEPDPPVSLVAVPDPKEASAGATPSDLHLLAATVLDVGRPVRVARFAQGLAAKGFAMLDSFRCDEGTRTMLRGPQTPFNAPIGPRRALAFSAVSLEDVRSLRAFHGVKVNDVVLALVGGALRSYLLEQDALPEAPLVSGVPVSTRADGDTAHDNQITTMYVSLGTDVEDPIERLLAVHRSSQSAKGMAQAVGARKIQSIGEVASPLLLSTAIRALYRSQLISRSPMRVNTLVSNVPGPPIPLYLCGAKVTGIFPCSVIVEGMGLNTTVLSNVDRVDFGLQADPDLVPDPAAIAALVPEVLAELMSASGMGEPTPVADPFAPKTGPRNLREVA